MCCIRPLTLALLGYLSLLACSAAEQIEIYYFANQQAYRVTGVEDGKPTLEDEAVELPDYTGPRHEAWWVTGDLPLEAKVALPFVDYSTKRVANSYQDRDKPLSYEVSWLYSFLGIEDETKNLTENSFTIVGWVSDGKISRFEVSVIGSSGSAVSKGWHYGRQGSMQISLNEFGGFPVCWIVENGVLVTRKKILPWDQALLGETDVSIDKLVNARDSRNRNALHYAAAKGDAVLADRLIQSDKKLVKDFDKDDISPLSFAVQNGRTEVVRLLLENKAPIADGWEDLNSIVRKAASAGHLDTLKLLAPGSPKGSEGKWHYSWSASDALNENYEDIAMYLIEQGADFTISKENHEKFALSKFSAGYPDLGFRLLEKFKLDASIEDDGYNLLHSVAGYADTELLQKVQKLGAKIGQQSSKGFLPMDVAVGYGNVDGICWFIDNGGSLGTGANSMDPLKHAIANGRLASVDCLIGYGYDVNREVAPDLTPLMYAVFLKEIDIARNIVKAGGVLVLDSPHIDVMVSKLAEADDVELISSLIEQGWTADRLVHDTFTLSECAGFFNSEATLSKLRELGWDVDSTVIKSVGQVEVKPRPLNAINVDYPPRLQEKFGAKSFVTRIALTSNGIPLLVGVDAEVEEHELALLVEQAVYHMRFTPAQLDGIDVPVSMKVRIPLKPDFDPEAVFSLSDVSEKPYATRMSPATYPYELQERKVKGRVVVEFILLPDRSVRSPRAIESSHPAFSRSAIASVVRSEWEPAKNDGKPVACKIRIPIMFSP